MDPVLHPNCQQQLAVGDAGTHGLIKSSLSIGTSFKKWAAGLPISCVFPQQFVGNWFLFR